MHLGNSALLQTKMSNLEQSRCRGIRESRIGSYFTAKYSFDNKTSLAVQLTRARENCAHKQSK